MKKLLKTKLNNFVLFFAIAMIVCSAIISYFFVRQNEPIIASLKIEIQNKQSYIRDIWNNIGQTENKANIIILMSTLTKNKTEETTKLLDYYLSSFTGLKSTANPFEILDEVAKEKQTNIKNINNLYLEEESIQSNITNLERENKLYSDIAFFLQILGLVIIMAKRESYL